MAMRDASRYALEEADAALCARGVSWDTLAPTGGAMPPLAQLDLDPLTGAAREAAARGVAQLALAMARAFPENLFADLVHPARAIARAACATASPEQHVDACFQSLVRLHDLYGGDTPIRFRYVHDFLYGFDWSRWVTRAPAQRAAIGPFDLPFLTYSEQRARELLELIAQNDAKYHRLAEGEARNPFPFRRDPQSEALLMRALAAEGAIPVEAWRAEGTWTPTRDYRREREQRARAMGLSLDRPQPGA